MNKFSGFSDIMNKGTSNSNILMQLQNLACNHHGKCLTSAYTNQRQKLLWECKNGHQWISSVNSVLYSGSWCPYCAGNKKLTLSGLQQLAEQKGGNCLSSQYVNSKTKLLWQCAQGHLWQATAFSIKVRNSWCPVCYKNNHNAFKEVL